MPCVTPRTPGFEYVDSALLILRPSWRDPESGYAHKKNLGPPRPQTLIISPLREPSLTVQLLPFVQQDIFFPPKTADHYPPVPSRRGSRITVLPVAGILVFESRDFLNASLLWCPVQPPPRENYTPPWCTIAPAYTQAVPYWWKWIMPGPTRSPGSTQCSYTVSVPPYLLTTFIFESFLKGSYTCIYSL